MATIAIETKAETTAVTVTVTSHNSYRFGPVVLGTMTADDAEAAGRHLILVARRHRQLVADLGCAPEPAAEPAAVEEVQP